jgi:hypothetical protein
MRSLVTVMLVGSLSGAAFAVQDTFGTAREVVWLAHLQNAFQCG